MTWSLRRAAQFCQSQLSQVPVIPPIVLALIVRGTSAVPGLGAAPHRLALAREPTQVVSSRIGPRSISVYWCPLVLVSSGPGPGGGPDKESRPVVTAVTLGA